MDAEGLLQQLDRIRDQRNRYRNALLKIICARDVDQARAIIAQAFKEDNPCQKQPTRDRTTRN